MDEYQLYQRASSSVYKRRVQERPGSVCDQFFLALKLCDEQQQTEALDFFERVLQLQPDHREASFYCGKTLFELGRYRDAEAMFLRHEDLEHTRGQRFEILAEIYRLTGRPLKARQIYLSEALSTRRHRSHLPHLALNEMMLFGIDVGVHRPQLALVDERLAVASGGQVAHCRLRIFCNQLSEGHKVVILTSEAIGPPGSVGVVNGAEWLVEHLLADPRYGIEHAKSIWVTMIEKSALGTPPMSISALGFTLRSVIQERRGWGLLGWFRSVRQGWVHRVDDVEFAKLSHSRLEALTGHKFFWE